MARRYAHPDFPDTPTKEFYEVSELSQEEIKQLPFETQKALGLWEDRENIAIQWELFPMRPICFEAYFRSGDEGKGV